MKCPHCGTNDKHPVERTKARPEGRRRTRRCYGCGRPFNTVEVVEPDSPITTAEGQPVVTEDQRAYLWALAQARCKACAELDRPTLGTNGDYFHAHMAWAPDVIECTAQSEHKRMALPLAQSADEDAPAKDEG